MLAELWRGEAFYFPMVGKGSWVVHAGDERRSTIEIYPRDVAFTRGRVTKVKLGTNPFRVMVRSMRPWRRR